MSNSLCQFLVLSLVQYFEKYSGVMSQGMKDSAAGIRKTKGALLSNGKMWGQNGKTYSGMGTGNGRAGVNHWTGEHRTGKHVYMDPSKNWCRCLLHYDWGLRTGHSWEENSGGPAAGMDRMGSDIRLTSGAYLWVPLKGVPCACKWAFSTNANTSVL